MLMKNLMREINNCNDEVTKLKISLITELSKLNKDINVFLNIDDEDVKFVKIENDILLSNDGFEFQLTNLTIQNLIELYYKINTIKCYLKFESIFENYSTTLESDIEVRLDEIYSTLKEMMFDYIKNDKNNKIKIGDIFVLYSQETVDNINECETLANIQVSEYIYDIGKNSIKCY